MKKQEETRVLVDKRKLMEENEALKTLLKSVQNVVEMEMKYSFPDCTETRRLESIVCEFKSQYLQKRAGERDESLRGQKTAGGRKGRAGAADRAEIQGNDRR